MGKQLFDVAVVIFMDASMELMPRYRTVCMGYIGPVGSYISVGDRVCDWNQNILKLMSSLNDLHL